jgi:hypothetical protein
VGRGSLGSAFRAYVGGDRVKRCILREIGVLGCLVARTSFSGACPGEELAVLVVDGALFGCLAGELGALEAEADVLVVCAGGDLAVGVVLGPASGFSAGAGSLRHSWAFLAGYSADAYLHLVFTGLRVEKDCICLYFPFRIFAEVPIA